MFQTNRKITDELVDVLRTEIRLAKSVNAITKRLETYINAEEYPLVRKKIEARGTILAQMVILDQRMQELISKCDDHMDDGTKKVVTDMLSEIRMFMHSNMSLEEINQHNLADKSLKVNENLKILFKGKKIISNYRGNASLDESRSQYCV